MRVIIGGGSGLIGQALALNLAREGNEVIVLSRHPESLAGLTAGIQAVKWDARTADGWYPLLNGADVVVNLAGASIGSGRWTFERKRMLVKSRVASGEAVVQAIELSSSKPRVVIQASAVGYYGTSTNERITEQSPAGSDFLAQLALEWENSTVPVERLGVRRVIVRTGVVLSSKSGALPKMTFPFRFFAGGRLGGGCQWFPWIHIDDEVRAIRFLMENPNASGPFNLTAPYPVTNAEFSRLLGQRLRRPSVIPVPGLVLRALFGEMATVLLEGQEAVPARLLQMGFVFRFPEAGLALKNLLG